MGGNAQGMDLAFATFFLNRTNRSGILNGGPIGGIDQTGPWKIDARYNKEELIYRINKISKMRRRISLTNLDAIEFISIQNSTWPARTLVYLDPPYYEKGRDLYYNFYNHQDHVAVALATAQLRHVRWMVSYDISASAKCRTAAAPYSSVVGTFATPRLFCRSRRRLTFAVSARRDGSNNHTLHRETFRTLFK